MPCGRAIGLLNRASRSLSSGTWNSFAVSKLLRHLALSLLRESHVFRRTLATFLKVKSASTFWKVGDSKTSEKSHERKNNPKMQPRCSTLQKWLWTASIFYYVSLSKRLGQRDGHIILCNESCQNLLGEKRLEKITQLQLFWKVLPRTFHLKKKWSESEFIFRSINSLNIDRMGPKWGKLFAQKLDYSLIEPIWVPGMSRSAPFSIFGPQNLYTPPSGNFQPV